MKNLFLAATAALGLLVSCNKDHEPIVPTPVATDGSNVCITLTDAADTRAFFDTTATAEAWEKSLSSLSVFAFDSGGQLIVRRDFTSAELAARSATFSLPKSAAGMSCSFYAVANLDASAKTEAALTALVENAAASYNGTFAEVSSKALRPGGFVMSGMKMQTVGAVNSTTNVGITLKRTVAKVALQTTVDASFAQKYSGTLTIYSVKLSKAASQSLVVAGAAPSTGAMTFTHNQTPAAVSGKYNSLFYIYENGALTAGNRVLLEIIATYDMDGNAATTNDRSEVTYSIELAGKAAGEILRNGYYRVAANITGLVGQECAVSVTVADWETPITQTVDLGA
ncbi:fimbrial protein [uncultured Alistipes sp.]|uniref:fimbrial protein n=1 Tax=uncultured Alistipes sp. TaxID=538949 RepID=UPI0026182074|nr:fimbrial protein [uncultured Alistipes sp.]